MVDVCRFCLSDENEKTNPLIEPCLCKGSMAFVHTHCIVTWLKRTNNDNVRHRCRVCKSIYDIPLKWPFEHIPNYYYIGEYTLLYYPFLLNLIINCMIVLLGSIYDYTSIPQMDIEMDNSMFMLDVSNYLYITLYILYGCYIVRRIYTVKQKLIFGAYYINSMTSFDTILLCGLTFVCNMLRFNLTRNVLISLFGTKMLRQYYFVLFKMNHDANYGLQMRQ